MTIERFENGPRFCRVLSHNSIVYLAGMTADDLSGDTTQQTRDVLAKIDSYLAKAGSDKSKILSATVWLRDIERRLGRFCRSRRLGDGRRRLHVRALYTLAIGGNAYRFVILGRSKERSDAAQTPG
ncbi:Rid family hydrolase, partial [Mesorhizobium sp.]|uniref:Rid family hydrolase n=1 Tax=Mesorhizobium sp. TaxID=1871066 RepID=UPI0025FAFFE5